MPQRETERSTGDLERLYSLTGDLLTGDLLLMAPLPLLDSNGSALSRMLIPVIKCHHPFPMLPRWLQPSDSHTSEMQWGTDYLHQQLWHKRMHHPGSRR